MPQLTLDYVRGEREVKFHEALYESLLRQYEAAKLDESRSAPMIQVVDPAQIPDTKSWPPRLSLVALFTILGLAVGAASVFYPHWAKSARTLISAR
jgi:tyrosine-protein kinase Etk/Wzc